ncbi:dnajc7 [Symbiodinium sp. KB8]|nr:dnajc7 [Symbiodinium sp. KB8]
MKPPLAWGDEGLPEEAHDLASAKATYRSQSLPVGYSFRFTPAVGQIALCHDSGVVISDRAVQRAVCSCGKPHLSFQYGPVQMFASQNCEASVEVSSDEPSTWSGRSQHTWADSDAVVGCLVVTLPCPACEPPQAQVPPESPDFDKGHRAIVVAVPCQAPLRPKARGLQVCLAKGNVASFDHLLKTDAAAACRALPNGARPLNFAIDLLGKARESSRCFSTMCTMILSLIECQADVNERAERGDTPLHVLLRLDAAEREMVQLCRTRLVVAMLRAKADPNALDESGDSPLMEAAHMGDLEMCKLLLEHGAKVMAKPPWCGLEAEVCELLDEALSRQQNVLSSLISSGLSFLRQDPSRAASCFADALVMDPLNPDILLAAAEAEYAAGNFASAYQHASRSVATNPTNGMSYAVCAKALWQLDRVEEAVAVAELTPDSDGVGSKQRAAQANARMLQHTKCLSAVEEILSDSLDSDLCRFGKAAQDLDSLMRDLNSQEQLSSWGVRVTLAFVRLCIHLSQPEKTRQHWTARALSETKRLRSSTQNSWQVLHWHARALLQAGCREDAINALRCASQLPGGDDSLLKNLLRSEALQKEGEAAAKQSSWALALEFYESAEAGAAFDPEFHALLLAEKARAKHMLNRNDDALKDVSAGLNIASHFASLYFVRGLIHMEMEMYPQAAADFDRVVSIDPEEMPSELREKARRWALAPPVQDHYAALGLSKTSTGQEVKKAYRLAALRWHPDKNVGNEVMAEQVFKQIQAAFDVLSCQSSRQAYDNYPGERKPFQFPSPDAS